MNYVIIRKSICDFFSCSLLLACLDNNKTQTGNIKEKKNHPREVNLERLIVAITNDIDAVALGLVSYTDNNAVINNIINSEGVIISENFDSLSVLFTFSFANPVFDKNGKIKGLDFNKDGVLDSLTFCTSKEGEHFNAWSGEAYKSKRIAYSYRYVNAELEPDCKDIEYIEE